MKNLLLVLALITLTGCGTFGRGMESLTAKITDYFVDYCERPPHVRKALFTLWEGELALKGITLTQIECPTP